MTTAIAVSFIVLVLMFVLATVLEINIGLLAFTGVFVVGTLAGNLSPDEILASFPADLFVLLAGVTYLFAVAQENGTVNWLTHASFRLARGNVALVPWIFCLTSLVITAVGALPGATVAILAPFAMSFAASYRINPLLMGVLVTHGSHAGSLSPISPIGIIVNGAVDSAGLPEVSLAVFLNQMIFALGVCGVAYLLFGGPALVRRALGGEPAQATYSMSPSGSGGPAPSSVVASGGDAPDEEVAYEENSAEETGPLTTYQGLTLFGILALVVLALGFGLDVGFTAFAIGLLLTLYSPRIVDSAIRLMAWPVILLICGVLTFIGVMDEIGALDLVSSAIGSINNPTLATLLVAFIGGFTSLFSTTAGVLGATVPLAVPSLQGAETASVAGAISSIAIASSLVDTSPASGLGALLLASLKNRDPNVYFRQLLLWGVAMLFVGSIGSWLLFVVIGIP